MRRSLLLLAVLLVGAGCGRGSFVGRRFDNFSAYYNTFYNAEKAFQEGVKALEEGAKNQAVDQDVYLSIFGSEERPGQTKLFDDAIKKSSDVLRDHSNSKWVDDALLLIGQSYFYLQNYVGAEQKFREILTLGSPLEDEARFWLARTLIASQQFEDAIGHLEVSLLRDGLSRRWEPMLRLVLGELYVRRGEWDAAATELAAGLENARDKQVGARAQFLLGQVYETLERYDEAVAAYKRVSRFAPFYELAYAAQYSAVRVEGLHGDPEEALRELRRMERDDKNYANRAELAYLRGRLYQAADRPDDADAAYFNLLYDSDANINTVRGRTHYALGELYRDVYLDYAVAAAHFDTAASGLRSAGGAGVAGRAVAGARGARQSTPAPAAITDGDEQARVFGEFARVQAEIALMDSLLYLGSLDEEAFEDRVLELRKQRAEDMAAQQAERERLEAEQRFQAGRDRFAERDARNRDAPNSASSPGSQNTGATGFLFHKDPVRVQDGVVGFEQKWGNRPLVPNWRRLDAVSGVGSARAKGEGPLQAGEETALSSAGLPEVDVSAVPRDSTSRAALLLKRALARYELGNVIFLSMNRPDSAAAWYRLVIEQDNEKAVAQRAYYALGEVQRALGDTLAARRIYRTILDTYPESDFVERVRERLGLPQEEAASDTLALAEDAYKRAYAAWTRDTAYETALNGMLEVAALFRSTEVAPRALLAAGSIYQEWAARDSLDLFDVLPVSVPDSLLRAAGLLKVPPPPAMPAPVPDSVSAAVSDSVSAAMPDSVAAAVSDSVAAAVPDSVSAAMPGSVSAAVSDSVAAAVPDSVAAAVSDSVAVVAEPEPMRLETLYASLVDHYPTTPEASRAGRVLKALEERWKALHPPDTTDQSVADARPDTSATLPEGTDTPEARRRIDGGDSPVNSIRQMLGDRQEQAQRRRLAGADSLGRTSEELVEERPPPRGRDERILDPGQGEEDAEGVTPPADTTAAAPADTTAAAPADTTAAAPADTTAAAPADTTAAAPADTTAAAPADTTAAAPADTTAAAPADTTAAAPSVRKAPDREKGGWTIVIASDTNRQRAGILLDRMRTTFGESEYAVDLFSSSEEEPTRYRIGLGFFATEQEAQAVREVLAEQLPKDAWLMRVPPLP